MNEPKRRGMVLAMISIFVTTVVFLPGLVCAGNLEPSAPPDSTMHTLDEIYQKLEELVPGGSVPLAKTGQTMSYAAGDDGDLQKGAAWPDPRFTDHQDGTVTDNRTGLMWTKMLIWVDRKPGVTRFQSATVARREAMMTGASPMSRNSKA